MAHITQCYILIEIYRLHLGQLLNLYLFSQSHLFEDFSEYIKLFLMNF